MCDLGCPLSDHYRSIVRALTLQTRYSKAPPSSFFLSPDIRCKHFFPGLRNTLSPLETFWEKNKKCIISSVWPQSKRPFESIFLTEQKLKLSLGRMHTMNGQLKSAPFRMSMMDFNKIPDRRHVNDFKL